MATIGSLDARYFDDSVSWEARLQKWRSTAPGAEFWDANTRDFRKRLSKTEGGARPVVNIPAHALLRLLRGDRYKNAYILAEEGGGVHVVVGAAPGKHVEQQRLDVDDAFGLVPAREYFFAAVSLEGTGVRYYGEYCMVLRALPSGDTQIVDRDSYEILFEPLDRVNRASVVSALKGSWAKDLADIASVKIRSVLERQERITTSVVQARTLLEGEEFIEIHLHLPGANQRETGFTADDVHEVRQDSRDMSAAERVDTIFESGEPARMEEVLFSLRRRAVERELTACGIRTRVVREERST